MPSSNIAELAFAIQSAKGTPASAATRRIYLSGGSLPAPSKIAVADTAVTTTRIPRDPIVARVPVAGAPEAFARPGMLGALLYAALGAKSVSGASDPFTHVFTMGASLPYLTLWRHYAGILNERMSDVRISRLTISGRSGDPLRVSFAVESGIIGYRTAQETAVAAETADTFLMANGHGALRIEGVAVTSISAFSLTIIPNVTLVDTLTGPTPMLSGRSSIVVQADQQLVDATLWNRMVYAASSPANLAGPSLVPLELAGSPAGIEFVFTEQATPERSIKLALPRVAVSTIEGMNPNTGYAMARMSPTYEAFAPAGGVSPLTATLKNSIASY